MFLSLGEFTNQIGFGYVGDRLLEVKKLLNKSDNEYSSNSDSDFSGDSDYSTNESDSTEASVETSSTLPIVSSSTAKSCPHNDNNQQNSQSEESDKRVYNLRPRRSTPLSQNTPIMKESVQEFASKIKLSETLSRINNQRQKLNNTLINTNFFSSDDE